eukprot:5856263-Amphidinium_carterae.1
MRWHHHILQSSSSLSRRCYSAESQHRLHPVIPAISLIVGCFGTPRCTYSVPSSAMAFLFSGPLNAFSYFSCATRSSDPVCLNPKLNIGNVMAMASSAAASSR